MSSPIDGYMCVTCVGSCPLGTYIFNASCLLSSLQVSVSSVEDHGGGLWSATSIHHRYTMAMLKLQ